jgi:hypothetical protein
MFACHICYSSVYNNLELLIAHEKKRGHWFHTFDSKLRSGGRRGARLPKPPDAASSSDEEDFITEESSDSDCSQEDADLELVESTELVSSSSDASPSSSQRSEEYPAQSLVTTNSIKFRFDVLSPQQRKDLQMPKYLSELWKNFTSRNPHPEIKDNCVNCIHCKSQLKVAEFWKSTSNLRYHLKRNHPRITLVDSGTLLPPPIRSGSARSEQFLKALALAFCTGSIPTLFIENEELKTLFKDFFGIHLPDRKKLRQYYFINEQGMLFW